MSGIVEIFRLLLALVASQPVLSGGACLVGSVMLVGIGVRLARLPRRPVAADPDACWKCSEPATAVLRSARRQHELRHCARHLGDTIERMRKR